MAIYGEGGGLDITLKCGDYTKTTTTQYKCIGISPTTTNADFTGYLTNNAQTLNNTVTALSAVGICQSYLSASSESMMVRVAGVSKAFCAATICAGDNVMAYFGASTTTYAGAIESVEKHIATESTVGVASLSTGANPIRILGVALQYGETNDYITILVQPSVYELKLIQE